MSEDVYNDHLKRKELIEKNQYGSLYWCIKTPDSTIHTYADSVEVVFGSLVLTRKDGSLMIAFAEGAWENVYAASCIDGSAVSVEHWVEDDV